jgi:antitoxin HicB
MTSRELLRKLRRLGATVDPKRGKGGHITVWLGSRFAMVPTGSGEIPTGTTRAILRQLGLRPEDLRSSQESTVMTLKYSALVEPEPEGGYTVTFPEVGIGATYGTTMKKALAQAEDMLEEAVLGLMAHNKEVPLPAPPMEDGIRAEVALPALTAAKLEAYRAMRAAGLDKNQLAERLGWQPSQVTRLFDGRHAARLDQIEAALAALGRRLVVTSEAL